VLERGGRDKEQSRTDVALCQKQRENQVLALTLSKSLIFVSLSFPPGRCCEDSVRTCELLSAPWIKLKLRDVAVAVIYFI